MFSGTDLYLVGGELKLGRNKWHNKILRYNSLTHVWCDLSVLPSPRRHFSLVTWDKYLYLIGGFGKHRIMLDSVDRYDTETG